METKNQKLKHRIAIVLEEIGGNQAELARIAEVSRSAVGQWRDGTTEIMAATPAFNIQDNLDFHARWLVEGVPPIRRNGFGKANQTSPPHKPKQEGTVARREGGNVFYIYYVNKQENMLLQYFRRLQPAEQRILIKQMADKTAGFDDNVFAMNRLDRRQGGANGSLMRKRSK